MGYGVFQQKLMQRLAARRQPVFVLDVANDPDHLPVAQRVGMLGNEKERIVVTVELDVAPEWVGKSFDQARAGVFLVAPGSSSAGA